MKKNSIFDESKFDIYNNKDEVFTDGEIQDLENEFIET